MSGPPTRLAGLYASATAGSDPYWPRPPAGGPRGSIDDNRLRRPPDRQRPAGRRGDRVSHGGRRARPMALAHPRRRDGRAPPLDLLPAPHARAPPGHGAGPDDPAIRASPVGRKAPPRDDAAPLPSPRSIPTASPSRRAMRRPRARPMRSFARLRDAGAIPPGVRFQVCLPTPMASAYMYVSPGRARRLSAGLRARPRAGARRTSSRASRPRTWPSSGTSARKCWSHEGFFPDRPADVRSRRSPASWRGSVEPCPMGSRWAITSATAHPRTSISSCRATRPSWSPSPTASAASWHGRIDFLHVPVPKDRTDAAYFQPLAGLRGFDDSTLYLGLIHHDDRDGDLARIRAARRR